MNDPAIETENLSKRYGTHQALDRLSLRVQAGQIYGFLGPNGAGKTTTLRMLMGMLVPDSGVARILGLDCVLDRVDLKRRVGYLPDVPSFYDYLTGWELLQFVGSMHGLEASRRTARAERLLTELEIRDAADEYVTNYSLGMKKRMALSLALIHDPEVLILDEPTTGLDPMGARQIQDLIRGYATSGRTVLLSTHQLEMAERVCNKIGILYQGRLVAEGPPQELRERLSAASGGRDHSLEEVFFAVTQAEPR